MLFMSDKENTLYPLCQIRQASSPDMNTVYHWRNLPHIVLLSLSQTTVDLKTHEDWFLASLKNENRILYIIETTDGLSAGLLRLDRKDDVSAIVTIYLDKPFMGKGIGTEVLLYVGKIIKNTWPDVRTLFAEIRADNAPSIHTFTKAGFNTDSSQTNSEVVTMVKDIAFYSSLDEDTENINFYTKEFEKHGVAVQALGWSSEQTQSKRFTVLSSIGDIKNATILDVGCGFGDLFNWLEDKKYNGKYTGVDITKEMVNAATIKNPAAKFYQVNILTDSSLEEKKFDYVFASGIFTFRVHGGIDYIVSMAERMFSLSRVGCAFNCLSSWGENQESDELTVNPLVLIERCKKITPWINLRHDYHPGDFTLFLYHRQTEEMI
jgi:SAM-dependent methyltransferase/ribosomal protein S18 acetylase RimI-like enzyme